MPRAGMRPLLSHWVAVFSSRCIVRILTYTCMYIHIMDIIQIDIHTYITYIHTYIHTDT